MDAITALREQLGIAHWAMESTIDGMTLEQFRWQPSGTANSIADNYLHTVIGEDESVHGLLQGMATLASSSWAGKTGISMSPPGAHGSPEWAGWVRDVDVDLSALREYAQAVYSATDQYVAGLTEADLDRKIDMTAYGLGIQTLNWILFVFVISHVADHMGEIGVVKGLQGLKGLPF
jgi:uncharacterized damage-inducible protein DinB